jgi:hypothetical protein
MALVAQNSSLSLGLLIGNCGGREQTITIVIEYNVSLVVGLAIFYLQPFLGIHRSRRFKRGQGEVDVQIQKNAKVGEFGRDSNA